LKRKLAGFGCCVGNSNRKGTHFPKRRPRRGKLSQGDLEKESFTRGISGRRDLDGTRKKKIKKVLGTKTF